MLICTNNISYWFIMDTFFSGEKGGEALTLVDNKDIKDVGDETFIHTMEIPHQNSQSENYKKTKENWAE